MTSSIHTASSISRIGAGVAVRARANALSVVMQSMQQAVVTPTRSPG